MSTVTTVVPTAPAAAGRPAPVTDAPVGASRPWPVLGGPGRRPAVGADGGRGAHHGRPPRGPPLPDRAGRPGVRRGGGVHLREPHPVRRRRRPGPLPPDPRGRPRGGGRGRRPTWSSPRRWPRCTRTSRPAATPACRPRRSWPTGGRGRPAPATSTGWPPWWSSCCRRPARAGPTSARRTSSSWPWCAGWCATVPAHRGRRVPDRAPAGRPGPVQQERPPVRRATAGGAGPVPGPRGPGPPRSAGGEDSPAVVEAEMARVVAAEPAVALDYAVRRLRRRPRTGTHLCHRPPAAAADRRPGRPGAADRQPRPHDGPRPPGTRALIRAHDVNRGRPGLPDPTPDRRPA